MTDVRAERYIVVGCYDSERNSWLEDGDIRHVCSGHRTERAAWIAADRHHDLLGGCDGSDRLTDVLRRYAREGSRRAQRFDDNDGLIDTYLHAGYLYIGCDFWGGHNIVPAGGALIAVPS